VQLPPFDIVGAASAVKQGCWADHYEWEWQRRDQLPKRIIPLADQHGNSSVK
jgi:hypothetical protein